MKLVKLKRLVILLTMMLSITSCVRNTADSFCLIYEPIFVDLENDTEFTIKQVMNNNVVYDELCK